MGHTVYCCLHKNIGAFHIRSVMILFSPHYQSVKISMFFSDTLNVLQYISEHGMYYELCLLISRQFVKLVIELQKYVCLTCSGPFY